MHRFNIIALHPLASDASLFIIPVLDDSLIDVIQGVDDLVGRDFFCHFFVGHDAD